MSCNLFSKEKAGSWIIHFASYIGSDYTVAVKNGKVINNDEYTEMLILVKEIESIYHKSNKKNKKTQSSIQRLKTLIKSKSQHKDVLKESLTLQDLIVVEFGVHTIPNFFPNLDKGKALYQKKCISCHGINGDGKGKLSKNMSPAPTNFTSKTDLLQKAPYDFMNTIALGVPGTSMQGFKDLNQRELWSLAHYIRSLAYGGPQKNTKKQIIQATTNINTFHTSAFSDDFILKTIKHKNKKEILKVIRTADIESLNFYYFKNKTLALLDIIKKQYKSKNYEKAKKTFIQMYNYNYEYIESLIEHEHAMGKFIESRLLDLHKLMNKKSSSETIVKKVDFIIKTLKALQKK